MTIMIRFSKTTEKEYCVQRHSLFGCLPYSLIALGDYDRIILWIMEKGNGTMFDIIDKVLKFCEEYLACVFVGACARA